MTSTPLLTMDTTDPNGQQTTINTRDEALRPTLMTYPTGATASASYDDDEPSESHSVTYTTADPRRRCRVQRYTTIWAE